MSRILIALAASAAWIAQCAPLPAQEAAAPSGKPPAQAEQGCTSPRAMVATLREFGEEPVAFGIQSGGSLTEVFASPDGATWSAVVTTPQGKACLVAEGVHWIVAPMQPKGPPA